MGYKALVRINSKRRMPLYAGTKLVSGDKGEYDKDGAESQFQSSCLALPCFAVVAVSRKTKAK